MKFKENATTEAVYKLVGLLGNVGVTMGVLTIIFALVLIGPATTSQNSGLVAQIIGFIILGIFEWSIGSSLKAIQNKMVSRD